MGSVSSDRPGQKYYSLPFSESDLLESLAVCLEHGGLILFPTDTVWSIGGDGADPVAVERLCNLRRSRSTLDFELLVDDFPMLYTYVEALHPRLETLLVYHRRPLTFLCRSNGLLPRRLVRPDGRVAVRLVRDAFSRALIDRLGKPLVTVFAAWPGQEPPSRLEAVPEALRDGVDRTVPSGALPEGSGRPAVVVSLSERDEIRFHRE